MIDTEVQNLEVQSSQGAYTVHFVEWPQSLIEQLASDRRAFFVIDSLVFSLHESLFAGVDRDRVKLLDAREENKTLAGVGDIAGFLQECGASRSSRIVLVGGGITQDVGVLAAHLYYRGVPYAHLPTTLLAMADSCIGAKCAVNHRGFKNQLGVFQSPEAVYISPLFLQTLANSELKSGYGEMLKLAVTQGGEFFDDFESFLKANGLGLKGIVGLIRQSLETKRKIIEVDEYDLGLRKTLNYGHTFGHALESITDHAVPLGQAVAWGLDLANYVALRRGLLEHTVYDRIHAIVREHFLLDGINYDPMALIAAMRRDKKASGNTVQLILLRELGRLEITPTAFDFEFEGIIRDFARL